MGCKAAKVGKISNLQTRNEIKEILDELPKLTEEEGILSLESGERTYTIEEVREHIAQAFEKVRADA